MPTYHYKVRDKRGKKTSGILEAVSEKSAADRLAGEGYLVTSIQPKLVTQKNPFLSALEGQVAADDMTMFYLQLGNMLDAGVTLLSALENVRDQIENPSFKKIVLDVAKRIEGGESFSEAMVHHSSAFPPLYRSMVQAGEASGNLGQVLAHVAELNEAKSELRHEIHSALAYPILLMVASVLVVALMVVWVIPSFALIFDKSGIPLPLPTRLVYGLSLFVKKNFLGLASLMVAGSIGFWSLLRLPPVKYKWDQFWISFPVIGLLIKRIEVSRWARSMALMLSGGVSILKTLEITEGLTRNSLFQETYKLTLGAVEGGEKLAGSLQQKGIFPGDVIQMVSTGESSGTLDKMLYKVAQYYDQLVKRSLKKLTSMVEPIFILLMGGVIGLIMLSILLPIFDMIKIFSPK